jgi:hypothetical protein
MSNKRGLMTRKAPTQLELERENGNLRKRCQQLEKRLRRVTRQLNQYEDAVIDEEVEAEVPLIANTEQPITPEEVDEINSMFLTFTLPDGTVKKVKRRDVES